MPLTAAGKRILDKALANEEAKKRMDYEETQKEKYKMYVDSIKDNDDLALLLEVIEERLGGPDR